MFVLSSSSRIPDPYLLLENPGRLSPSRGPQTSLEELVAGPLQSRAFLRSSSA